METTRQPQRQLHYHLVPGSCIGFTALREVTGDAGNTGITRKLGDRRVAGVQDTAGMRGTLRECAGHCGNVRDIAGKCGTLQEAAGPQKSQEL